MLIFEIRRPDLKKKREQKEVRTALTGAVNQLPVPESTGLEGKAQSVSCCHTTLCPWKDFRI